MGVPSRVVADLDPEDVELHRNLSANVHRIAFLKGIPLEAVARAVDITLDELLAICSGEIDPDLDMILRIARALDVRPGELFEDPMYN